MNDSFASQLKRLSAAEEFLEFFGVPFEKSVVNVNRLHILKRFYQYIRQAKDLPDEHNDEAMYACYRGWLVKAYEDFVKSTPAQEKVFKVFQVPKGLPVLRVYRGTLVLRGIKARRDRRVRRATWDSKARKDSKAHKATKASKETKD